MDNAALVKERWTIREICQLKNIEICHNKIKSIYREEDTSSLHIYDRTNSYYDFSTGQGGDVITFYKIVNGLNSEGEAIQEMMKGKNIISHDWKPAPKLPEPVVPDSVISGMDDSEKRIYELMPIEKT